MKKLKLSLIAAFFMLSLANAQTLNHKVSVVAPPGDDLIPTCHDVMNRQMEFNTSMFLLGLATCDLANAFEPNAGQQAVCHAAVAGHFDASVAASMNSLFTCLGVSN